jgi:hypothetical protein
LKKANASQLRTFRSSSGLTTIDQLYQAAKQEGARFPGIKVSVTSGFSNILHRRSMSKFTKASWPSILRSFRLCRITFAGKRPGLLLPFKPDGFDQIDPSFKDADGAYFGVWVTGLS